ncbi:MAG: rRNA maturation RNase YbeY [Candidatus Kerfeldbacteria bacterium]|nr:rRNA maturation RNase YbeY [Candidatus Kerfeldbacteria bacterium]
MTIVLDSIERGARAPLTVRRLRDLARRTLSVAGPRNGRIEISVAFVNSSRSRALNRQYRKKDVPADVLSFRLDAASGPAQARAAVLAAEIVLCPPAIRTAAKAGGRSLARQTELLFIHGLLHVLGYDHRHTNNEEMMHTLEERAAGEAFAF